MSTPLNILITGANGFVGSHLLRYLSEKHVDRVTGLVRPTSNLERLGDKQYRLLYSSLNDPLEEIMKGFDAVIHTAANTTYWGNSDDRRTTCASTGEPEAKARSASGVAWKTRT